MDAAVQSFARGTRPDVVPAAAEHAVLDAQCRVCELETENARLRLLVSELLVANQRLREDNKRPRMDQDLPTQTNPSHDLRNSLAD
jgi:hypothetical protein